MYILILYLVRTWNKSNFCNIFRS